jgi:hypothetical protein
VLAAAGLAAAGFFATGFLAGFLVDFFAGLGGGGAGVSATRTGLGRISGALPVSDSGSMVSVSG